MASPAPVEVSVPVYAAAPLPPGWTEHRAPTGQFYYYHAASGESTYVRPSVPFASQSDTNGTNVNVGHQNEKKASGPAKKREKPKTKVPIPETSWLRVTTTEGNVFYTNVETKVSSWTVPLEIAEQVARYDEAELRKKEEQRRAEEEEARLKAEEARRAYEAEQRRLIELEVQKVRAEVEAEAELRGLKRKQDDFSQPHALPSKPLQPIPTPAPNGEERKAKMAKTDEGDEDEEWQRQIAAEMAMEAANESNPQTSTQPVALPPNIAQNTPAPVGLSIEELRATFKAMLLEKNIDPMAPWDNELPKFVTDTRYLALPSMKERRDLFDEFCKEKIRQQRAAKQAAAKVDPPQAYRSLLIEFVSSTRMLWEDFKMKHKKDSRFRNFGRDDREREKVFKSWLKELGEQKRKQLARAEDEFNQMLDQLADPNEEWKDVRDRLKTESRLLAVTSNSMKETLWKKWVERKRTEAQRATAAAKPAEEERREKQQASLKAREEQVREMKRRLEKETDRTKNSVGREEAEREFKSFLIDYVRDHDADWADVRDQLERDPRNDIIKCLPQSELGAIFSAHTASIYSKRLAMLETFFEHQAPCPLTTTFAPIKAELAKLIEQQTEADEADASSEQMMLVSTVKRLIGSGSRRSRAGEGGMEVVEKMYGEWRKRKEERAREEFEEMCGESAFIEFWCRMKKAAMEKKEVGKATIGEEGEEEAEEDEMVDLREMAKAIDIREIEMVMRKDKRWTIWDHVPEKREEWIRTYLDKLAVPKKTVYQKDLSS